MSTPTPAPDTAPQLATVAPAIVPHNPILARFMHLEPAQDGTYAPADIERAKRNGLTVARLHLLDEAEAA